MVVFLILLLTPLLIQHVKTRDHQEMYQVRNRGAMAFFFVFLTILVMLRHESVGNDTQNYIRIYRDFTRMDWIQVGKKTAEFGYSYFNKIISIFTKEPQIFLAMAAIITSLLIYPTYKRLCLDASLTIVLFCVMSTFVMLFSGIRQMLAVGLGFVAYDFVRNQKKLPFVLIVLLAITVHTSAFMLIFMYPLYYANITKKWLYIVIPVLAVIFVFNRTIFAVLSLIVERYTKYDGSISSTGAYTMLILFVGFAVFSFLIPDEARMDRETVGLRNFLLLSLVLQMFAPLHTLAMRMNYYYIIFIPLLLPKVINARSERWEQVAIWGRHVMVVFFLLYFFANAYGGGNLRVFPYHFFWETVS